MREQFQADVSNATKDGSGRVTFAASDASASDEHRAKVDDEARRRAIILSSLQEEKEFHAVKIAELEKELERLEMVPAKDAPVKASSLKRKIWDISMKYFRVGNGFPRGITNAAISHVAQQVVATKDQELITAPLSKLGIGIDSQLAPKQVELISFTIGALCAWLIYKGIGYTVNSDEITDKLGIQLTHSPDTHVMAKLRKEAEKRTKSGASDIPGDANVPIQPNLGHFGTSAKKEASPDKEVTFVKMVPSPASQASRQ